VLPTTYNILPTILVSWLTPYSGEIIWDHQCVFGSKRSTTAQIFCTGKILEKKCEYNRTVHRLFIDSEKARDSVL
jgi:hypothetical protein